MKIAPVLECPPSSSLSLSARAALSDVSMQPEARWRGLQSSVSPGPYRPSCPRNQEGKGAGVAPTDRPRCPRLLLDGGGGEPAILPNCPAQSGCRDSCSPPAPPDSAVKPASTSDAPPRPQRRTQTPD